MALHLRSNPAPRSGALFVSNPRKRKKVVRKNRRKATVKKLKLVRKRKTTAKKRKVVAKKRKNPIKKRKVVAKKRKNTAKKRKVVAKKRKNPSKKRKVTSRKRKVTSRKRKVVSRKRKNPIKRRKVVSKAKRKNPIRRRKSVAKKRRSIVRKNPASIPLVSKMLKPIEKIVSKIPVIGKTIAPLLENTVLLVGGGAGVIGAMTMVGSIPVLGEHAQKGYGNAYGSFLMGLSLAVVTALVPKSMMKAPTKKALALAFAGAGGAINMAQLAMNNFDLDSTAEQNKSLLGTFAEEDLSVAEEQVAIGDGMFYEIQPLSGISIDSQSDMAGIDYQSSELGDAMSTPHDLSAEEGHMAMQGRQAYLSKFGMPARKIAGEKTFSSQFAGKRGHRWGWLIKSLGYNRFARLASMEARERRSMIAKLKASAIQASQSTFDRESKGGMQGIAMNMSGLAIDNMAGIAMVGAGI